MPKGLALHAGFNLHRRVVCPPSSARSRGIFGQFWAASLIPAIAANATLARSVRLSHYCPVLKPLDGTGCRLTV